MERLRDAGFVAPIRDWIADDRPFLGICLGLQLLFEGSDEDGAETLGVLPGRTVRLEGAPTLPHIGWNQVERTRPHPAFDGIDDGADFYFVHSYVGAPAGGAADAATLATTSHGRPFVSAVARGRLLGVQFHPERSRRRRPAPDRQRRRPAAWRGGRLMLRRRVIPCLDVANGRVVKGTRFVDLVDAGDPPELAERYAREGADELVFLDITAAPEGRATLLEIVERTARRAFIPLTVGGGVRSVDEMRDVLRAGRGQGQPQHARPSPIRRSSPRARRGSAARRSSWRSTPARSRSTAADRPASRSSSRVAASRRASTRSTGRARAVELGAGELLVTSIDRDGTKSGFDTPLLRAITSRVGVPVIASGGASGPADFVTAVVEGGADAVLAAGIFHRRRGDDRRGQGRDGGGRAPGARHPQGAAA